MPVVSPPSTKSGLFPKPKLKITASTRRRLKIRKEIWPEITEEMLWVRANFTGFTSIPRTMPLIVKIINDLDRKNAGSVFFDLWCRAFEDFVIEIKDEYDCAFCSGYIGQRGIRSWRERIEVLSKLGFIKTYKTIHGVYRYIIIVEPHKVIMESEEAVGKESISTLQNQLISIGATK